MTCPICKRTFQPSPMPGKSFGPFCSDRCQLIDLGRWLDGAYQIEARDSTDEDLDESIAPIEPRDVLQTPQRKRTAAENSTTSSTSKRRP
jgi:endogenous inhibitor of DNA gyrase (YacG/DUF329 family)